MYRSSRGVLLGGTGSEAFGFDVLLFRVLLNVSLVPAGLPLFFGLGRSTGSGCSTEVSGSGSGGGSSDLIVLSTWS